MSDKPRDWTEEERAEWPRLMARVLEDRYGAALDRWLEEVAPGEHVRWRVPDWLVRRGLSDKLTSHIVDLLSGEWDGSMWIGIAAQVTDLWMPYAGYDLDDLPGLIRSACAADEVQTAVASLFDLIGRHMSMTEAWPKLKRQAVTPQDDAIADPDFEKPSENATSARIILNTILNDQMVPEREAFFLLICARGDDWWWLADTGNLQFDPGALPAIDLIVEAADQLPAELVAWARELKAAILATWPEETAGEA